MNPSILMQLTRTSEWTVVFCSIFLRKGMPGRNHAGLNRQLRRPTISTAAEQKMMLCLARPLLLVLAAAAPVAGGLAREAGRVDLAFPAVPAAAPTGTRLWTFSARGFPVKQSPTVSNDGTMVYVGSSDNFTYAVNAADGTQIWSFNLCGGQDVQGPLCS